MTEGGDLFYRGEMDIAIINSEKQEYQSALS